MGNMYGTVDDNRHLKGAYWLLEVLLDGMVAQPQAGRFLMLKVSPTRDPLLRRPFGIHDFLTGRDGRQRLKILYKVCGRGTGLMTGIGKGEDLDMLGPLGRGFDYGEDDSPAVIVAGGIGGAPLLYLARRMAADGRRPEVVAGGNTVEDLLGEKEFRNLGLEFREATMDGSRGFRGTAVDLLLDMKGEGSDPLTVYACGPWPMLSRLADVCRRRHWKLQATVDALMACGLGICFGCAVKAAGSHGLEKYLMACHDGPVFDLEDLAWDDRT